MPTHLRRLWRLPAPPRTAAEEERSARVDLGLVVFVAVSGVLEAAVVQPAPPWRWASLAALLVWLPTLFVRRSRPLVPVVVFSATVVALAVVGRVSGTEPGDLSAAVVALAIPFSLARWAAGREAVLGLALFGLVAGASLLEQDLQPGERIGGSAVVIAAVALGVALRSRAMLRGRELDDVRRDERERLARDLHDTVGHHLTAIAITAQAGLAVADDSPAAARDALRRIDAEASRTLAETRAVVRLLRTDDEGAPDRPLADLAGLASEDGAGPRVEVSLGDGLDDLSPTLTAALHRIAQESVANARRHARGATRVDVSLARTAAGVELTVRDDGRGHGGGDGFGIIGMTERAGLLGGTLHAGPDADGGWLVRAVLPERTP